MAKIQYTQFFGEATGVTPRLIPPGFAAEARNVDVRKRTLRGIRASTDSGIDVGVGNAQTIYRYRSSLWFAFVADIDIVRSPILNDAWSRIYWTGQTVPRMAALDNATAGDPPYPNSFFNLGVTSPTGNVIASEPSPPQGGEVIVSAAYVVTLVSTYGEEGPPTPASNIVERYDGGSVTLDLPAGTSPGRDIDLFRIYRTEGGGQYYYVGEVANSATQFIDDVDSANLLTPLPSENWLPPDFDMIGLMEGPANSLCGFFDNVVCFSESNLPHAWPLEYRYRVDDDIVGMARSSAGIVIATRGRPFLLVGNTPESVVPVEIETDQACVSKRSVVSMGDYVIYASPEGLVAVGQGASLITEKLMEREEWRELNPYTIHAYREGDRYIAFYQDKSNNKGAFGFTPERGFEFFDEECQGAYYDKYEDKLYLSRGATLKEFDNGNRTSYRWRSGISEMPPGVTFSSGKVIASNYPVTLRLLSPNYGLQVEVQVLNNNIFRLPPAPAGPVIREWQVEIEGENEVFSVQIAQTASEII